jgi:hypothetical protein
MRGERSEGRSQGPVPGTYYGLPLATLNRPLSLAQARALPMNATLTTVYPHLQVATSSGHSRQVGIPRYFPLAARCKMGIPPWRFLIAGDGRNAGRRRFTRRLSAIFRSSVLFSTRYEAIACLPAPSSQPSSQPSSRGLSDLHLLDVPPYWRKFSNLDGHDHHQPLRLRRLLPPACQHAIIIRDEQGAERPQWHRAYLCSRIPLAGAGEQILDQPGRRRVYSFNMRIRAQNVRGSYNQVQGRPCSC